MPEYAVLDKDTIKSEIMPCFSMAKRGFSSGFDLGEIVNAILYKLRSGCQRRLLPMGYLFSGEPPSRDTVFQHYRKWSVKEEWEKAYSNILRKNKKVIGLYISHIDGSHTPACRRGEQIEYQDRKKRRTTNALFLSDNQGIPLAISESQPGNHADLYEIGQRIGELVGQLANAGIAVDRVFCNLDAGFDGKKLRSALMSNGIVPNVYPNPKNRGEYTGNGSMTS
ncbi:MAG: transposase [Bacteroides sp.]|nr:transposase [Bacteroides sp.]